MIRIGPDAATCELHVLREGLLATWGHDLALELTDFQLAFDVDAGTARGVFQLDSVRVMGVLTPEGVDPSLLSDSERATIEEVARHDILRSRKHPEAVFRADGLSFAELPEAVVGSLDLCGVERALGLRSRREGERWKGRLTVHQPDHGIAPFRSLLGALRVQADVSVEVTVDADRLVGFGAQA